MKKKKKITGNLLKEADQIVNRRAQEKKRRYGDFSSGMIRTAKIASEMRGKQIDVHDVFCCLIALKFSRQSFAFKYDNLLDAVGYIAGWENYISRDKKV